MDYYKTLGVDKKATEGEIKKAYRRFAHQYHPDSKGGGDEKKFKEVTEAYEVLSDRQKRAQYDQFGHVGRGPTSAGGGAGFGGVPGFDFSNFQNVNFDFGGGFGDIFDNFFGGGGRRARRGGPLRGEDIEVVMPLEFEESIFGAVKEVEITRQEICEHCKGKGAEPGSSVTECSTCNGTGQEIRIQRTPLGQIQSVTTCSKCQGAGRVPEKKCTKCRGEKRLLKTSALKIKIPAGIHDKAALRIKDKGEAGLDGGESGDLLVYVTIAPSREFERHGYDIHTTVTLHVLQAVLGDEIPVKTVHGEVTLRIPAGTHHGQVFKIKGKGVPRGESSSGGDHLVTIELELPKKLSRTERELYEKLAAEAGLNPKQNKSIFG